MAFDHKYPYTDFHELNLDWILEKVQTVDSRITSLEADVATIKQEIIDLRTIVFSNRDRIAAHAQEIAQIYDNLAQTFDENSNYIQGAYVKKEGFIYRFINSHNAGPWDADDVVHVIIGDEMQISNFNIYTLDHKVEVLQDEFFDTIAKEYDENHNYQSRDYCIYEEKLYRNTGGNTTGTFDPSKWTLVLVTDEIDDNKTYMVAHGFAHYDEVLTAGSTSVIFAQTSTYDDTILVFTDQFGLAPTAMSQDPLSGFWTITFPAQVVDVNVRILIYGTYEH